jgi:hypothetical protein
MFEPKFKKTKMEAKPIFGLLLTVFAIAFLATFVSAADLDLELRAFEINDAPTVFGDYTVIAGDVVEIRNHFIAHEDANDVEISVWIRGFRSETIVSEDFADLVDGRRYVSDISLQIPSDLDDDDMVDRELVMVYEIESDEGSWRLERTIQAQRESHDLDLVLVEFDSVAKVDSILPVSVVVKNTGRHEEDDTFVTVSIPALGISKTTFFEDLFPIDVCDDEGDCDRNDARERRVFVSIPAGVAPGLYDVKVTARSDDAETTVIRPLSIVGTPVEGTVLANPTSQTMAVGQQVTYDLIVVNSGSKIGIYTIVPEASDALSVSLSDSLITVPAGSSKTVKVFATANREGTFSFTVNAVSDGLTQSALYGATVEGKSLGGSDSNVVVLTVVLAIIFVVLLIILIVLLTRKPEQSEEFGESYY